MKIRYKINISGIVQGVGFRPFIHKLVKKYQLKGWIRNSNQGVEMEIEGEKDNCQKFFNEIRHNPPPLTLIEEIKLKELPIKGFSGFQIKGSNSGYQHPVILMPPDISICDDCLKELNDPLDRRYNYPFINCTNCGPRFTIIKDMPYDRDKTTMNDFIMCNDCDNEYHDIENRRYHAEPNACSVCGPELSLFQGHQEISTLEPIMEAQRRLKRGEIGVIKGLGGFHLACDAQNRESVSKLRLIKKRDQKPFALMSETITKIKEFCHVPKLAKKYLESRERPIVLLKKKSIETLSPELAPENSFLGFMLPYTPLHYLLLRNSNLVLVMTSANFSDEPIIIQNEIVFQELADQVDFILLHNREIFNRCDDSVLKIDGPYPIFLRRSRGYAPFPILLSKKTRSIFTSGPEEKNTVCLARDGYAFPSQHLGDLKNKDNFIAYQEAIGRLMRVFQFKPEIIACDLHPDYLSTHYAEELSEQFKVPLIKVQHHHAHIASCLAENGLNEKVIGVALDGTGFGTDRAIWGGEFLITTAGDFKRVGHLKYIRMPGGEQAIHEPWRMAFSYLYSLNGLTVDSIYSILNGRIEIKELKLLKQIIDKGINSPYTSSCGRLFDAVSSLIGLKDRVDFEGQAAIELESYCRSKHKDNYNYKINRENTVWVIDTGEMFNQIVLDLNNKIPKTEIATRFHNTVSNFILSLCVKIREEDKINYVALSGGVFQNSFLLTQTIKKLKNEKFKVLIHKKLPPNDACISLGQVLVADAWKESGEIFEKRE